MKRVLITGASSGIGLQLARDYLAQGDAVWACGRDATRLAPLQALGATLLCFDGRDAAACQQAAEAVPALDLAILNAGTCEYIEDARAFDGALFARVIETNLIATGQVLAAFLPRLVRGGRLARRSPGCRCRGPKPMAPPRRRWITWRPACGSIWPGRA